MSRFKNYLNENNAFDCLIFVPLDEMSDDTFKTLKTLGSKIGIKVNKSSTIWDYLKKYGKWAEELLRFATLYAFYANTNPQIKNELTKNIKDTLRKVNKKELMDFFMQLDKTTLSLTAIPRHVLQSVFGIQITTYQEWVDDKDYILNSIKKIKSLLKKHENKKEELEILNKLERMIEGNE